LIASLLSICSKPTMISFLIAALQAVAGAYEQNS